MEFFNRAKAYLTPLPPDVSGIVYDAAKAALGRGLTGFFSRKSLDKLADLWVPMIYRLSVRLGVKLTEEESLLLFRKIIDLLGHIENGIDINEAKLAQQAHGAPVVIASRIGREAVLTTLYGRSIGHAFLRYRNSLTLDQLAVVIVKFALDGE